MRKLFLARIRQDSIEQFNGSYLERNQSINSDVFEETLSESSLNSAMKNKLIVGYLRLDSGSR